MGDIDYIEQQIDFLLANPVVGPRNNEVYIPKLTAANPVPPFDYVPHCVCFYYVRIDHDGMLRVDHYLYVDGPADNPAAWKPIPYGDMPRIVAELAKNGRPHPKNPPELPQHNFEQIVWNRRCYIAIFIDEAHWKLHKRANGDGAIVFNPIKGPSTPNSSFFDAADIEIDMSAAGDGSDLRSAIYFVNHLTCEDAAGQIVPEQGNSEYTFDIYFDVAFASPAARPATIILDPGGTNMGPAQKP